MHFGWVSTRLIWIYLTELGRLGFVRRFVNMDLWQRHAFNGGNCRVCKSVDLELVWNLVVL